MAARKAKKTKRYTVSAYMQTLELHKAGSAVTFEVKSTSGKLGEIQVGQGTFGWKPANIESFKRMNWDRFADKMNELFGFE